MPGWSACAEPQAESIPPSGRRWCPQFLAEDLAHGRLRQGLQKGDVTRHFVGSQELAAVRFDLIRLQLCRATNDVEMRNLAGAIVRYADARALQHVRSEERRVGKECR